MIIGRPGAPVSTRSWKDYIPTRASRAVCVLMRPHLTLFAMAMAVISLLEGQAIFFNAQQVVVHGSAAFTGFAQVTVSLAGLQLSILGAAAFLALAWPRDRISNDRVRRSMSVMPMLCGTIVLVEGLLVLQAAAPITVGEEVLPRTLVAAFGAQLFFLGSVMASTGPFGERKSFGTSLGIMGFLGIIAAGLWTASIAEQVTGANFSGFHGRTVMAAGAFLAALGSVGLLLHYLEGRSIPRTVVPISLGTWAVVALTALIALGGLVGLSIADDVRFATQGGLSGTTVAVVMFAMFVLGLMASMGRFMDGGSTSAESKARLVGLFLVLLLPFAVLA